MITTIGLNFETSKRNKSYLMRGCFWIKALSNKNKTKRAFQKGKLSLNYLKSVDYLFKAVATSTAQATVQPTIGLLPIPKKPIIST